MPGNTFFFEGKIFIVKNMEHHSNIYAKKLQQKIMKNIKTEAISSDIFKAFMLTVALGYCHISTP